MTKKEFIEAVRNETLDEIEFKPFNKIEELLLKKEYLPDYYRLKREYDYNRGKIVKGLMWRDLFHLTLVKLVNLNRRFVDKQELTILNDGRKNKKTSSRFYRAVTGKKQKPVIYAITHIDKYDYQIVSEALKNHQYPFAGDPETMYRNFDGLVLGLNGVILCDTGDKTDRKIAKETAVEILNKGENLLIYPEGVWNVTSNLLMLPLFPGIIQMAKETDCDIVPVAIERYGKEYIVNIGCEFSVKEKIKQGLSDDEIKENLRDEMATLRWAIMESLPKSKSATEIYYNTQRSEMGTYEEELDRFQSERLNEWVNPKTKEPYYNSEIVRQRTYKDKDKYTGLRVDVPETAFAYMEKAKLHKNNIFMFSNMFSKDESLPTAYQQALEDTMLSSLNDLIEEFDQEEKQR